MPIDLLRNGRFSTDISAWDDHSSKVVDINLKIAAMWDRFPGVLDDAIEKGYIMIRHEKIKLIQLPEPDRKIMNGPGFKMIALENPITIGFSNDPLGLSSDIKNRLIQDLAKGFL